MKNYIVNRLEKQGDHCQWVEILTKAGEFIGRMLTGTGIYHRTDSEIVHEYFENQKAQAHLAKLDPNY